MCAWGPGLGMATARETWAVGVRGTPAAHPSHCFNPSARPASAQLQPSFSPTPAQPNPDPDPACVPAPRAHFTPAGRRLATTQTPPRPCASSWQRTASCGRARAAAKTPTATRQGAALAPAGRPPLLGRLCAGPLHPPWGQVAGYACRPAPFFPESTFVFCNARQQ